MFSFDTKFVFIGPVLAEICTIYFWQIWLMEIMIVIYFSNTAILSAYHTIITFHRRCI